jgi:hypothetical protein
MAGHWDLARSCQGTGRRYCLHRHSPLPPATTYEANSAGSRAITAGCHRSTNARDPGSTACVSNPGNTSGTTTWLASSTLELGDRAKPARGPLVKRHRAAPHEAPQRGPTPPLIRQLGPTARALSDESNGPSSLAAFCCGSTASYWLSTLSNKGTGNGCPCAARPDVTGTSRIGRVWFRLSDTRRRPMHGSSRLSAPRLTCPRLSCSVAPPAGRQPANTSVPATGRRTRSPIAETGQGL